MEGRSVELMTCEGERSEKIWGRKMRNGYFGRETKKQKSCEC